MKNSDILMRITHFLMISYRKGGDQANYHVRCQEFIGKSCYANFYKLKHKIMLGEFHVSRGYVMRGLPVIKSE